MRNELLLESHFGTCGRLPICAHKKAAVRLPGLAGSIELRRDLDKSRRPPSVQSHPLATD